MFERIGFIIIRDALNFVLWLINGNIKYEGKEKLPKDTNYVLVSPHRSWWDPVFLTVVAKPKRFCYLAKEELFKNPILRFILTNVNVIPVNRENPGMKVIKAPVKLLKETDMSLIMFPNGSRKTGEVKGGVALIAKMGNVPIVPVCYQGPVTTKGLAKRKRGVVRVGDPIYIDDIKRMNKDGVLEVENRMLAAFDKIDKEINPEYVYIPEKFDEME